ncbi:MAG TPA: hypothetical protein VIK78_06550 [Ruminiclostridium sp.]
MNKEVYKSAVSKIQTADVFKAKLEVSMKLTKAGINTLKIKRLVPVIATLLIIICISTIFLPRLMQVSVENNTKDEFKIMDESSNAMDSYASVVYIYGYSYSPSEWLKYSRYDSDEINYDAIRGLKIGEVTLDLKGKRYTGTPPDFSSTFDKGTEIYTIKNIKKESAVLVVNKDSKSIFYRQNKVVLNEKIPINLTVLDVLNMLSDTPKVSSVELRDENDGSWMRTSEKERLLSLINKELPKLAILNSQELGKEPYSNNRIPINLILKDGAALHMQIYPETKCASVFGGYIKLSSELYGEIQELFDQGEKYPSISKLLPYKESDVSYLYFVNNINGEKVLCENPIWSRDALFSMLNYYRVEQVKVNTDKHLVMTSTIGKSKDDNIIVNFYETEEKQIITEVNGVYYKPVKGQMLFKELSDYLYNSTDLGLIQK